MPANVCTGSRSGNAAGAEIQASFNSANPSWYYGTDGNPGPGQYDLESVVMHELAHGLGFVGSFDGLDPAWLPTSGLDNGKGWFGLNGDGMAGHTIYDAEISDGSGRFLDAAPYANGSLALGSTVRGANGGARWAGANGVAANGGSRPLLYSPRPWQEGSSFAHLDENAYPGASLGHPGNPNALMTPELNAQEVEHDPGPVVLGMFKDMGWPASAGSPILAGEYHALPFAPLPRIAHATVGPFVRSLDVNAGALAPLGATAVAVNIEVKAPTAKGYLSVLPGCNGGPGWPDSQDYAAPQTRTSLAILPMSSNGHVRVTLSAGSAVVNVDLLGWFTTGGAAYHHLQNQQIAAVLPVSATAPVDVRVAGRAGIPVSGAAEVVLKARVSASTAAGWLFVSQGHIGSSLPTSAYGRGEMISSFAIVPLAADGTLRLRVSAGTALVSLEAVGWYGSGAAGQEFHSAGPFRYATTLRGQEVVVGGLPDNSQVMLDVHLANPTANGWLGSAPAGHPVLHGIQEYYAGRPVSGTIVTTTNTVGQVRLHLSAGLSTMYVDYQGWFSAG